MLAFILFVLEILSTNNTITDTNSKDNIINTDEILETNEGQILQDNITKFYERRKYFEENVTAKPIVDDFVKFMYNKIIRHLNTFKLIEVMEITEEGIRKDVLYMLFVAFRSKRYEEITEQLKKIRIVLYDKDPCYEIIGLIESSLISLYLREPPNKYIVGLFNMISNIFSFFISFFKRISGNIEESKNE